MAFGSNRVVFEIRSLGNDTNGGGFNSLAAGTDYSQSDTKRTATGTNDSTTDAVANGTTTITSATANFTSAIVGNIIYLQGGTGGLAANWYEVTARTNATTITVDRNVGTGTGMTMNIGGAIASIGRFGFIIASGAGNFGTRAWIKADGTYTMTLSAGTNVATGRIQVSTSSIAIDGYNTTRGDNPTGTNRPLVQFSGAPVGTYQIDFFAGGSHRVSHLRVEGNGTSASAFRIDGTVWNVKVSGLNNGTAFTGNGSNSIALDCEANTMTGVVSHGFDTISAFNCVAVDAGGHGFTGSGYIYVNCIAVSNTGAGFSQASHSMYYGCVAYGNTTGFTSTGSYRAINCIAEANGVGGGFAASAGAALWSGVLFNCGVYNNTGANISLNTGTPQIGTVTGTGSFFTNAAAGDFTLNSNAGGGADLQGVGYGVFPDGLTVSYPDIGAAQVMGGGGGGGGVSRSRVQRGM